MPIKLPKGFPRRKSSGNVLDDLQSNHKNTESTSSFKVLARPSSTGRSLEGGNTLRSLSQGQPHPLPKSSFDEDNEGLFSVVRGDAPNRGSGGTNNSLSTAQYDSGASSSRLSTASTNPSSIDTSSTQPVKQAGHRSYEDISAPSPPAHVARAGFLKNAGRTFSFGINRNNSKEVTDLPPAPPVSNDRTRRNTITNARERAMTASTVTTTVAPRLDDSGFSLKEQDDDFGNMFANLGDQSSRDNPTNMRPAPLKSAARAAPPQPIHVNHAAEIESSPYSWHSQDSRDGLIASPSPARTVTRASPQPSTLRHITIGSANSDFSQEDNMFETAPRRRSPESTPAKPQFSPPSRPPPSAFPPAAMHHTRAQSSAAGSTRSFQSDNSEFGMPMVDPALLANAQLATAYEERQPSPINVFTNKVMTPAEFERYKQQKEDTRKYNKVFGKAESDDGSGDNYDDEEEDLQEREKQAVKQRKKQEAHLAVYRQQMMKVTGDTTSTSEQRPATSTAALRSGNSSQLDLPHMDRRMSSMTVGGRSMLGMARLPVDDEPDEDEDVPLGILAAHGFPSKNRPPTRLGASSSNPNLRQIAQTQGGASVAGGEGGRGPLPAFARHLPADPYYGASLVHQAERVPLAMHAAPSQNHLAGLPQPSGAATGHPVHPAGLVGVIAGEERARAARRGSPNPQTGAFDVSMGTSPGRGMPQHMPNFPPQGMMTSSEQAQMQMSQSMNQMMQMQMQWMQQMSSMMGQNPNMQMPMMQMPQMPQMPQIQQPGPQMMQPYPSAPLTRPQSVPLQSFNGGQQQRTMSTLAPSMAGWNHSSPAVPQINAGESVYAHSIAPSERSNVGLASRYRPVSIMPQEPENNWAKRASTFSAATFRPWTSNENGHSKPGTSTVRTVQHVDDDDDEQGWAELKARKEKKQKSWKLRKRGNNTLQELYNAPA